MRLSVAAVGLLVALSGLCAPALASRPGFLSGAHDASGGSYAVDKSSQPDRHPSRRLLQGSANAAAAVSAGATPARSPPPPAAVVINATGNAAAPGLDDAAEPPDNRGNIAGAQFGFQFNNNVAFIGVAIILGLAVSCFWGVCGVYRRRRLAAHRFSGPPGNGRSGDIPEVQLVPQDVKMTVQPIVVIQPDNESIAYTFRELEPEGVKGDAKGDDECNADGDCAGGSTEAAQQQADAAHSDVRSDTDGGGDGRGGGDLAIDVTLAAGEGAAGGNADSQPAAAARLAVGATAQQPADMQQEQQQQGQQQQQQPGEAVAALQEAGLLRRHSSRRRRPLGIPQMLEWDLGAALAALDAERAATDQPSLSRGVASAALTRSASGALAPGSRAGSFVALSRSPSGALGPSSRTPSAAALQRSPSGGLAAGSKL